MAMLNAPNPFNHIQTPDSLAAPRMPCSENGVNPTIPAKRMVAAEKPSEILSGLDLRGSATV